MSERREAGAVPICGGGPSAVHLRDSSGGAFNGGGLAGRKSPDEPAKDGTQPLELPGVLDTGVARVAGFALAAARSTVRSSLIRASVPRRMRSSSSAMSICAWKATPALSSSD